MIFFIISCGILFIALAFLIIAFGIKVIKGGF
jgi:hypothetical protein